MTPIDKINRPGKITASRAADLMTNGRGKDTIGQTALSYALELALKQVGVDVSDDFTSWQMEWGIEHEPDAREIYEASRGVKCELPGFITKDKWTGCTPDGLVGDDGMLEIKCPQWKAHTDYILNGCPPQYFAQIQFQLMITGRKWCDFMTFHPEFPDHLKAKVFRVERDEAYIDLMRKRVEEIKPIIQQYVDKLNAV